MEPVLQKIADFADQAHGEQMRKYSPERYIVHPIRVMQICQAYTQDTAVLAAALLHDVLEDTPVNKAAIGEFLTPLLGPEQTARTLQLVEELTDVYIKADYPHWNRRKRKAKEAERMEKISPAGQMIKYADIIDNSLEIAEQDADFAKVFLHEGRAFLKKMNKGDPQLRQRAVETVEQAMRKITN